MATHINAQAAHRSHDGFAWRHRFEAAGAVLRAKLHEFMSLIGLIGLITSFCSSVIWLGAAVTGQSSLLGMVLMGLLFVGSACATLALCFVLRRPTSATEPS